MRTATALLSVSMAAQFVGLTSCSGFARAGDRTPGIVPINPKTPASESGAYPPELRVGDFNGAYRRLTLLSSVKTEGNGVAIWEAEVGSLNVSNYPNDEFVLVVEGDLTTTDASGIKRQFLAGDSFVIPRGWTGVWEMKSRFRKIRVIY